MKVKFLGMQGTWRHVADSANTTINKDAGTKEPSPSWKRRMLRCEHSPIRQLTLKFKWFDLPYWVSTHFCRHWLGIVHWVRTQRTDRTGVDREVEPQGAPVEHEIAANPQALINISRKRLCLQASDKTRQAWKKILASIKAEQPEIVEACVPDCVYRGYCYEYKTCGFHRSAEFQKQLAEYRKGINEEVVTN